MIGFLIRIIPAAIATHDNLENMFAVLRENGHAISGRGVVNGGAKMCTYGGMKVYS